MKQTLSIVVLLCFIFYASTYSEENDKKYGVVFEMGSFYSINGSFSDSEDLKDIVNPGMIFSFGMKMKINRQFFVEMLVTNGWMNYKNDKKPIPSLSPSFAITNINFDNVYYIYRDRYKIKFMAGPGIYYWRFTDDGPFGKIQKYEGEKFYKMSIGGDIGMGFEVDFNKKLSLSLTSRYHYILSKDRFFFGNYFSEQGLLDIRLGILGYFNSLF